MWSKLRHASKPGRVVSATVSSTDTLLTTFTRSGNPGDPTNIEFLGTSGQIATAAGWYRADEIDFVTSVRISVDCVLGRKYSTAPVSDLFLFGRKEDMAFQKCSPARPHSYLEYWPQRE